MDHNPTASDVASVLRAVMNVPIGPLEQLVQDAHESNSSQKDDPPQRFVVSRQALRMLWHFRSNLDVVDVFVEAPAHA